MVSNTWFSPYCGGLICLFLLMPCAFAEQFPSNIGSCPLESSINLSEEKLRRQLSDETLLVATKPNAKIATITLEQLNVFNTHLEEENNALFRFANRAHIQTEPEVIKNLLLFNSGDLYDAKKLSESERLLRKENYLYDAQISATENCDGDIDVKVITRDLWTLLPEINFSRSGGENKSSIGFRESNLFGWGKRLSFSRTTDSDRSGYLFVYDDPNKIVYGVDIADHTNDESLLVQLNIPFNKTVKSKKS